MSPPHHFLHFHLPYRCRHSGACCSSGWPIPIEHSRAALVALAVEAGRAHPEPPDWLRRDAGLPEVAGILATRADGACVFHRPAATGAPGCAIHAARPAACEHFPYVSVIDPRGVHVTLSHYCPTAAALLFEPGEPRIVEGPPVFADGRVPEGLDATEVLPPVAAWMGETYAAEAQIAGAGGRTTRRDDAGAPGRGARPARPRLLSWEEVSRWEQACALAVAGDARVPEGPSMTWFEHARAAVPAPWTWPVAPEDVGRIWAGQLAPAWPQWAAVIGRYLAAKVHASWAMHLGRGPVDVLRGMRIARTVLQVEAARACAATGRPLDRESLTDAIRQADLLLMHYADPRALHGQV